MKTGPAKTTPKNHTVEISPARKAAFQILMAVERAPTHSDDQLRGKTMNALSTPDRNLATALVLGVLRWQIRLDHQLQALLKRPYAKVDSVVLVALRLGAFQVLQLDRIPAYAAISESVELAKRSGHRFASGMINAVLRQLSTAPPVHFSEETTAELALAHSHPAWMVERWINFYGLDAARAICRHGQNQPVLTLRLASPAVDAELVSAGIALEAGELLTAVRIVLSGDVTATEAFRMGRVRLQDEGSQLVAEIAGSGSHILDCCAAPGGKTLILAERNPAARILACEVSFPRHEQLQKRLAYLGDRVECRKADATGLAEDSVFDLVLADVPCSGTGTLGRNPEIRNRTSIIAIDRQAERQRAILTAALRAVRPGGRVVYSTCSLELEENEQVVAAVLAATPNTRLISLEARIEALLADDILTPTGAQRLRACLTPEGALRLLPGTFHTDGFFICLIERTA
ncbi:MAG: transcription antitermination factor NusB [Terracidiphilus sp.]